jgi:hypothetical protein
MAELRITINLDNDAFRTDEYGEVSRILEGLSRKVLHGDLGNATIKDANGNTVGSFTVQDDEA